MEGGGSGAGRRSRRWRDGPLSAELSLSGAPWSQEDEEFGLHDINTEEWDKAHPVEDAGAAGGGDAKKP